MRSLSHFLRHIQMDLFPSLEEVFAAQMDHVDHQIGRIVATLDRIGELDNTLIFITADNGASGEGGLAGTFNETYVLNGMQTPFDANMRNYENWGQADSYPHYHAGWAMAGNTPFPYFKQSEHRGGQHDALVVHWPDGIEAKGEVRSQYHHISDIAPTIMQAVGIDFPEEYHGIPQQPFTGVAMNYCFDAPDAPNAKKRQYYEMFGNRAIWVDGWKAVTLHANRMPWDVNLVAPVEDDVWELYNVEEDFSESTSLAGASVRLVGNGKRFLAEPEDVNGDGRLDLMCQILTDDLNLEVGDSVVVLEAQTFDGTMITGSDFIRIVPD